MKLRILALASAAIAIASTASAADLGRRVAPVAAPAPVYSWQGLYVGIHGGAAWGEEDSSFTSGVVDNPADYDLDGAFIGAQIGYNFLFAPNLLVGIEADGSWGKVDGGGVYDIGLGNTSVTQTINDFGSVRARLGFVQGPWLFYATGGWAWAEIERHASKGAPFAFDLTESATYNGWTVGGGVEVALSQKISLKAEYKYFDFGSATYFTGPGQSSVDVTAHTATVGLNFKLF